MPHLPQPSNWPYSVLLCPQETSSRWAACCGGARKLGPEEESVSKQPEASQREEVKPGGEATAVP